MRVRRIILPSVASRLYSIFPHYLINDTIFENVCFDLPRNFVCNISHENNNCSRYVDTIILLNIFFETDIFL